MERRGGCEEDYARGGTHLQSSVERSAWRGEEDVMK
jgi:hypothetical protein